MAAALFALALLALCLGAILLPAHDEKRTTCQVEIATGTDAGLEKSKPADSSNHRSASAAVLVPVADAPGPATDHRAGEGNAGDRVGNSRVPGAATWKSVPVGLRARCSVEDRMARLEAAGATPECEEAVVRGLRWLKDTQQESGAWPGPLANTGFALLAYSGHCITPVDEEFGDSCLRGITHLIQIAMQRRAKLTSNDQDKYWCYEHAINTCALAEAALFCNEFGITVPNLSAVVKHAGQIIIDNQTEQGGWEYGYKKVSTRGGGDLSITTWQLEALNACRFTSVEFRNLDKAAARGISYVEGLSGQDGSFGYAGPGRFNSDYGSLTGAGMLCMQRWGKGSNRAVRQGAEYILKNTKFDYNSKFADLYGHYFESQAMYIRGGEQWKQYNALFRDQLLANQAEDGSWKVPGNGKTIRTMAGLLETDVTFRTCLAILMLEVYYRDVSAGQPQANPPAPKPPLKVKVGHPR